MSFGVSQQLDFRSKPMSEFLAEENILETVVDLSEDMEKGSSSLKEVESVNSTSQEEDMVGHDRSASGIQLTDIELTMQYERKGFKLNTNRKIIKKAAKKVTRPNMESYCATDFGESVTNTSALGLVPGESNTPLNLTQMSEVPPS